MDTVERLIGELERGGRVDSRGEFTLDTEKAREKLRRYQLSDPQAYILELVQAAVLKGATAIRLEIDTDDTKMAFDGEPFTRDDYDDLYQSIFTSDPSPAARARRHLALGLNGALATKPRYVRFSSARWTGGEGLALELRPDAADEVVERADVRPGTLLHVKSSFESGLFRELLRHLTSSTQRETYVRTRCRYCRVPVSLGGELVSGGLALPDALVTVPVEGEGLSGLAGFEPTLGRQAEVRFLANGVLVTTEVHELGPLRLVVLLEGRGLRTNLAESGIVRNEAYDRALTAVLDARERAVVALCDRLEDPTEPLHRYRALLDKALRGEILDLASLDLFRDCDPAAYPGCLLRPTLWRDALQRGPGFSFGEILEYREANELVPYSHRPFDEMEVDDELAMVVLIPDKKERSRFRTLLGAGRSRNVADRLRRNIARHENLSRWRSRPHSAELGQGYFVARATLEAEGVRGEVGLRDLVRKRTSLRWIKDGCLLASEELVLPFPAVEVVVEADFKPTKGYDGIRRDDELAAVGAALARVIPSLFEEAAGRNVAPSDPDGAAFREIIGFFTNPDWVSEILQGLGFHPTTAQRHAAKAADEQAFEGPRLDPNGDSPLRDVACWPILGERMSSVAGLQAALARDGTVRWVHTERFRRLLARNYAVRAAYLEGNMLPEPVLEAHDDTVRTLRRLFGSEALVDGFDEIAGHLYRALFLAQPTVPAALDGAVVSAPVDGPELRGEVGLLDPTQVLWRDAERTDGDLGLIVTVLREGRRLADIDLASPIAPLWATVDDDRISTSPDWSSLDDPKGVERIREAIERALPSLLETISTAFPTLDETLREPVRHHMLVSLWRLQARYAAETAIEPRAAIIRTMPLFPIVGGGATSLETIEGELREHHTIQFVLAQPRFRDLTPPDDRPILSIDPKEHTIVQTLVGTGALEDVSPQLESRLRSRRLGNLPLADQLALRPGEALVTVGIDDPQITGEIGLAHPHAAIRGLSILRLTKHRRSIGTAKIDIGLAVVGCLDDDRLVLDDNLRCDTSHESFHQLLDTVRRSAATLFVGLAERWPSFGRDEAAHGWRHVLDFVALHVRGGADGELRVGDPAAEGLLDIDGFTGADGNRYSLRDIARSAARTGEVRLLSLSSPGEFRPPDEIVVVASPYEWERLEAIFPQVTDYSQPWREILLGRRNRDRARPAPVGRVDDPLVELELTGEAVHGHLYLPPRRRFDLDIDLTHDGRVVESRRISELYPCRGVATGPGIEPDRSWRRAVLSTPAKTELGSAAYRLYRQLAGSFEEHQGDPEWPSDVAASYLLEVSLSLHRNRKPRARKSPKSFYHELSELRLLPLPDGRRMSLKQAMVDRPRSLEPLRLWKRKAAIRERPVVPPTAPVHVPPESPLDLKPQIPAPAPPGPSPAPPGPSPVERLLEAVRDELQWVQARRVELLSRLRPDQLSVGDGPEHEIASYRNDGVVIHRSHPLVRTAIDHVDDEPLLASFIAAAVYTALNYRLAAVTDADEQQFVGLMADLLATRRPGEGGA